MSKPTVLIVDDEVMLQEILCEDLSLEGWNVKGANNGIQALDALRTTDFDLIVSDVHMPQMDGMELLRSVRQVNSKIIFALMTGYTEIPVWDCFALGANEVFGKPFRIQVVNDLMERSCRPLSERWGIGSKRQLPSKIHKHLDVVCHTKHQGFGIGRNGFFVDPGDTPNMTRGDIISFHVEMPRIVLDGVGKIRWKRRPEPGLSGGLGIEFLFLEESCRQLVIKAIEDTGVQAMIPSGVVK